MINNFNWCDIQRNITSSSKDKGSPHLAKKKGWLDFSQNWLNGEVRENLEDFRKARNFNISFPIHMSPYLSQIKRAAQQS